VSRTVPDVSVIIPAYRAAATIAEAIDSVMGQTHDRFELIVVDDGSDDDTGGIVAAYGSRVELVRQANAGVSRARNAGLARARGRYVAFLDADDVWRPRKLELQTELLDSLPHAGLCFTALDRIDEHGHLVETTRALRHPDFVAASLLHSVVINSPSSSVLARTALVRSIGGFDARFSQCADWDISIRLALRASVEPLDEPLTCYRVATGSMSSDISLLERDTFAVLDAFYESPYGARYRDIRRRAYANQWRIVSGSYLHAGHRRDAMRCLANAVRWHRSAAVYAAALPIRSLRRPR
jgi:glycosyltransferase involved in cell wall biosynthesis